MRTKLNYFILKLNTLKEVDLSNLNKFDFLSICYHIIEQKSDYGENLYNLRSEDDPDKFILL